jgi:hypothetical protein
VSIPSPTQLTIIVTPSQEEHALFLIREVFSPTFTEEEQTEGVPRYHPNTQEAYCKYCYKTHRLWTRFLDVFPDEIVWECGVCQHRTRDEFMQIVGEEQEQLPIDADVLDIQQRQDTLDNIEAHVARRRKELKERQDARIAILATDEMQNTYGTIFTIFYTEKRITMALSAPVTPAHIKDIADLVSIGVILGFVVKGEINLGTHIINNVGK